MAEPAAGGAAPAASPPAPSTAPVDQEEAQRAAALRRAQWKLKEREKLDRSFAAETQRLRAAATGAEQRNLELEVAVQEAKRAGQHAKALRLLQERELAVEQAAELAAEADALATLWSSRLAALELTGEEKVQLRGAAAARALQAERDDQGLTGEARQRGLQALQRERAQRAGERREQESAAVETAMQKNRDHQALSELRRGELSAIRASIRETQAEVDDLNEQLMAGTISDRQLGLLQAKMEAVQRLQRLQDDFSEAQQEFAGPSGPQYDETEVRALRGLQAARKLREQRQARERLQREREARLASARKARGSARIDATALRVARDKGEFRRQALMYFKEEDGALLQRDKELEKEIAEATRLQAAATDYGERHAQLERKLDAATQREYIREERAELLRQRDADMQMAELDAVEKELLRSAEAYARERGGRGQQRSAGSLVQQATPPFSSFSLERSASAEVFPELPATPSPKARSPSSGSPGRSPTSGSTPHVRSPRSPISPTVGPRGARPLSPTTADAPLRRLSIEAPTGAPLTPLSRELASGLVPEQHRRAASVARAQTQLDEALTRLRRAADTMARRPSTQQMKKASGNAGRKSLPLSPAVRAVAPPAARRRGSAPAIQLPPGLSPAEGGDEAARVQPPALPPDTFLRWRQVLRGHLAGGRRYSFDLDAEWALAAETKGVDARGGGGRGGADSGEEGEGAHLGRSLRRHSPSGHHLSYDDEDEEVAALLQTLGGGVQIQLFAPGSLHHSLRAASTGLARPASKPAKAGASSLRRQAFQARRRSAPHLAAKEVHRRTRRLLLSMMDPNAPAQRRPRRGMLGVLVPFPHTLLDGVCFPPSDPDSSGEDKGEGDLGTPLSCFGSSMRRRPHQLPAPGEHQPPQQQQQHAPSALRKSSSARKRTATLVDPLTHHNSGLTAYLGKITDYMEVSMDAPLSGVVEG